MRFRQIASGSADPRLVPVTIDLDPAGKPGGVVGYRARKTSGLIDMAKIGAHPRDAFWEPIVLALPASVNWCSIPTSSTSSPRQRRWWSSAMEAAEMVAYDTSVGELRSHYAGFLDPGFGLAEAGGAGSKIVLEVRSHDVPFLLDHGQRVATLEYEPMAQRPDRLYGESLRSNYQGQGLKLSKHFS